MSDKTQTKLISKLARRKNGVYLKQVVELTEAGYKKKGEKKKYISRTKHIPVGNS